MTGQQLEAKFVNEWISTFHPTKLQWKRVRLGPFSDFGTSKLYQVTQRWADAVLFDGDTVFIIEAKLRRDVGIVSQLKLYRKLFRETPEFSAYKFHPIRAIILLPFDDMDIRSEAALENIEFEVFSPDWIIKELSK